MKVAHWTMLWASLMSVLCLGQDSSDAATETTPPQVNRWAVVVGIKDYEDENILPLKYADRDAEEFYDLIRTEAGGAFPERQIKKLINKEATTANVTQALRGFLKQAGENDLVLLFFSCHGAADPDAKSQVVSLLTYDTKADDISSSAVPMREIQHSLDEIVRAKNVVILIDACHAGGAIKAKSFTRDAGPTPDLLLAELKKAGAGTAFLMSAGPNQQSFEDDSFHHGVFTHFLLKGIKEELADTVDDDVIRVGELFDYVREEVQKLKGEKQVPQLNSGANRDFPLAVTNEQSARTRLAIGTQLYELGLDLGVQQLLRSAVRHGEKAAHGYALISGRQNLQAEAWMLQGKSLLALDEPADAVKSFAKARAADGDAKTPEAVLYLGIAAAKAGDGPKAQEAVETFVNMNLDTGHERLRWAEDLANWLKDGPVRRRALLIGVDRQGGETRKNDVELMKSLLLNQLRFTEQDVKTMIDDEVTYLNLDAAVKEIQKVSQPDDHLLVYFSGDATADSLVLSQPPMILANDSLALIANVAGKKCVILDTSYIDGSTQIADQDPDLHLLWAVDDGQEAHESERHGFFTLYLSDVLTGHIGPLTNGSVLAGLRARFASTAAAYSNRSEQVPSFHGDLRKPFLGLANPIDLFDLNEARSITDDVGPQLAELYSNYVVDLPDLGFDNIHLNLGRYWLDQPDEASAKLALSALRRYHEPPQKPARLNAVVSLARAELREGNFDNAANALKRLQEHPQERVKRAVVETLSEIESLRSPGVQALLIGIDKYQNPKLSTLQGAGNDIEGMERLLRELGITDITVLRDEKASRVSIMEQYEQLLKRSVNAPVVFYFAGYGSLDTDWNPTILSHDARSRDPQGEIADISLLALAQLAAAAKRDVVPIVDAGSELGSSRFVVPEVKLADEPNAQKASEFAATQFAGSLGTGTGEGLWPSMLDEDVDQVQGTLTHGLLTEIRAVLDQGMHPSSWDRQDVVPFLQDQEFFEPFWKPLFDTRTRSLAVDELLKKIWYIEIGALVEELDDIAARWPTEAAATLLDKCILAAFTGDYPTSLHAARQVMLQLKDSESLGSEAKYHYGRVLYESRDNLLLAVDQLQAAVAADEVDLRARYYAGQAILALVQADYGPKASEHLGKYLAQGAPLGHYGAVLTTMARLHDSNRGELDEYGSEGAGGAVPFERILPRTHQQSAPSNQFAMGASAQGYLNDPDQPALKKWEVGAVINVAFVNGDDQQKERVKQAAAEWTKYCNVSFEFIGDPNRAVVRTEFGNSGSWSYVGTDCLRLPASQATMSLPGNDGLFGIDLNVHALREFGHVLGLGNEQSQPNASLPWNQQAVYVHYQRMYGWTKAMIDQNVLQVTRDNALGIDKPFDRDSIMMYPIPAELLLDETEVTPRTELSLGDKRFVEELYPLLKPTGEFLRSALTERIDTHIHKLTITRPSNYVIETAGNTRVKLQLERASERGSSIGGHDSVDGVNDRIKARLTADNYTVTVKHAQAGGLGEYRIRVTESY